jgi:transposase-like protein
LARAGRSVNELAREFEPSANAIRKWVKQAGLDDGLRSDGLITDKRFELNRLRRENQCYVKNARYWQKPYFCQSSEGNPVRLFAIRAE